MSSDLNSLTNSQLREKLLDHGYDIPSSVNKDFLVKKLQMVLNDKSKKISTTGRKSVGKPKGKVTTPPPVRPVSIVSPSSANNSIARRSSGRQLPPPATPTRPPVRNNQRDEEEQPLNRSIIRASTGRSTSTRNSVTPPRMSNVASRASVSKTLQAQQVHFDSRQDDNEDDDEDEPMDVQNRSVGYLSQQRERPQPQRRATPPRSSLRPASASAAPKRARPHDDSPPPSSPLKRPSSQISQNMDSSYLSHSNLSSSILSTSSNSGPGYSGKFGIIVNGRKVQSECTPNDVIDPKKFIFNVPDADAIEYVVVFLHENQSFVPGTAGQVYFGWPDERNEIKWHELGHVSNIRPSAIFNVSDLKQAVSVSGNRSFSYGIFHSPTRTKGRQLSGPTTAQIGISIEPLEIIVSSLRPDVQL